MAATRWSPKDPEDVADYFFDWTDFLPPTENIIAATVGVPPGMTSLTNDFTTKTVRVRLAGGTAEEKYPIDCLITTDAGQVFDVTNTLSVKERTK